MAKAKYKKGSDGYWKTNVWNGTYTAAGKKRYTPLRSNKSSKDLEEKVNDYKSKIKERTLVKNTDQTFCEYAVIWLNIYKANRSHNTKAMYKNIIDTHFSAIKTVKLSEISRLHYQYIINLAEGKKRTQQQIQLCFKQVIKSAIADKYLPAAVLSDIFDNVDKIKYSPNEKRPLAPHEKKAVFEADLPLRDKAFLYILYGCGLRRAEALALTRFDINLEKSTLTVQRAIYFDKNEPHIKEPKSENGYRTVPIPSKIKPVLEEYIKTIRSEKIFFMAENRWVSKSSYDKMWARIVRALEMVSDKPIDNLTAHVFRHNYCTNLCYQIPAISIKKIAELMGDTEKMVLEVYNHILQEKEDAASAVENALHF